MTMGRCCIVCVWGRELGAGKNGNDSAFINMSDSGVREQRGKVTNSLSEGQKKKERRREMMISRC